MNGEPDITNAPPTGDEAAVLDGFKAKLAQMAPDSVKAREKAKASIPNGRTFSSPGAAALSAREAPASDATEARRKELTRSLALDKNLTDADRAAKMTPHTPQRSSRPGEAVALLWFMPAA